ncbi:MAG TPA: electron transport complex subunit RsxA [Spirochaetota bacterium]|nr:electron transport complex subunit RsxA [Spirochaetota bacterium]HPP04737.1 electron transport complex subunit RsxA [Spirochaetota bacterium]
MSNLIIISIGTIFINNFVLARFLGLCPFIGVSKKLDSVLGMGLAVIFVMTLSSMVTYVVYHFILLPYNLTFLKIIVFILVIASLVQLVEIILKKNIPSLYNALGIYLPLITTNCAVLGVAVLNIDMNYDFISSTVHGFMGGVSFLLALFLMATIRERLEMSEVPEAFKGAPIAFISAGLMALAFLAADKSMLEYIKP